MWWLCIYIRESSKRSKVLFYYPVEPHLTFSLKSVEEGAFHRSFHHISSLAFFIDICKLALLDYTVGQGHLLALQVGAVETPKACLTCPRSPDSKD